MGLGFRVSSYQRGAQHNWIQYPTLFALRSWEFFTLGSKQSHVSHNLKLLKGGYIGDYIGTTVGDIKGDTRSLDYGPCGFLCRLFVSAQSRLRA